MATIDIRRDHTLELPAAKRRVEEIARMLEERAGAAWRWDGDVVRFDVRSGVAKGVQGAIHVDAKSVRIVLDMPFYLKPLKAPFEAKIKRRLEEIFKTP